MAYSQYEPRSDSRIDESSPISVPLRGVLQKNNTNNSRSPLRQLSSNRLISNEMVTLGRTVDQIMQEPEIDESYRYPKPSITEKLLELLKYIMKKE